MTEIEDSSTIDLVGDDEEMVAKDSLVPIFGFETIQEFTNVSHLEKNVLLFFV
jgi:hypothetical protein